MKNILRAIGYFIIYIMLTILLQGLLSVLFMGIAALKGLRAEAQIIAFANSNILGITVFSGILTIVVFYLIFKIRKKDIKAEWKLNRFDVRELLLPVILSFSYSFLFALITYDITMENSAMIADSAAWYSGLFPMLGFFMTAINLLLIAPVSEELVLRGVIYTRIEKTGRPIAAIAISSLLFGCMHIAAGGSILVIGSVFMGAVLGYILYRYDSLWVCMIAHAAANLPDFILSDHPDLSGSLRLGLEIVSAIVFLIALFIIHKRKGHM